MLGVGPPTASPSGAWSRGSTGTGDPPGSGALGSTDLVEGGYECILWAPLTVRCWSIAHYTSQIGPVQVKTGLEEAPASHKYNMILPW